MAKKKQNPDHQVPVRIEYMPLADLRRHPRNPKNHDSGAIGASIERFGFTSPPLIDETTGLLAAGHGRLDQLQTMKDAGATAPDKIMVDPATGNWLVPVVRGLAFKDEQELEAYLVADNRTTELGGWSQDALIEILQRQQTAGTLLGTGFDAEALKKLLTIRANAGQEPNADGPAPEPPTTPTSQLGDLYILGGNRLLCGDSTNPEHVAKLMNGQRASLMNTDPPYGVNYGDIANSRARAADKRQGGSGKDYSTHDDKTILNDELDGEKLQVFLEAVIQAALPHLIEKPAFYLWHPMLTQGVFFAAAAAAADILIHRQIIWVKPSLIMGRGDYHWRHELCFYGWIRGKHCAWKSGHDQDTVWEVGRENDGIHPTQKPVELFRRPLINHTDVGDICYEPFSGSGSQLIAAQMLDRRCFAMELDPRYVDVDVQRWEEFTGKKAERIRG